MATWIKVLLITGVVFGVGAISCVGTFIGTNNEMVSLEQGIKAQYNQNRNNYDNMWKKIKEVAQVPEMYTNDLKKVFDSAIQNRYGENGSQAVFQFITEQNPNFDPSMYKQIQQTIEAGRNSFEANQKMLLDKKRVYETKLGQFPTNFIAGFLGFPKIDLSKYDIVTSDVTEQAFETKKADEIKLR